MFPGFTWVTPGSVLLGLVEAFLYGVYVALVFVPLFNHFEGGTMAGAETPTRGAAVLAQEAPAHR
jgi:hypothetical protein